MTEMMLPRGIAIDDPRPIMAANPYTFFLPHTAELAALKPLDRIKAIFRQTEGDPEYSAERMWVVIEAIENGMVTGTLDNDPAGMDMIRAGDRITIPLSHAISTAFHKSNPRPQVPESREYWERCFVNDCVLERHSHVDYLYREEPYPLREGETYRDSGWRLRGTSEAIEKDEIQERKVHYIALGKVLNVDDRWLPLIDREIGTAFVWDAESAAYIELN